MDKSVKALHSWHKSSAHFYTDIFPLVALQSTLDTGTRFPLLPYLLANIPENFKIRYNLSGSSEVQCIYSYISIMCERNARRKSLACVCLAGVLDRSSATNESFQTKACNSLQMMEFLWHDEGFFAYIPSPYLKYKVWFYMISLMHFSRISSFFFHWQHSTR